MSSILGLLEKLECNFDLEGDHRSTKKRIIFTYWYKAKNNQSLNVIVIGCFDYVNYGLGAVT